MEQLCGDEYTETGALGQTARPRCYRPTNQLSRALIGLMFGVNNPDWSSGVTYDTDLRSDIISHTVHAEFRWEF